jgi:ribosomal protein L37AE/L43A
MTDELFDIAKVICSNGLRICAFCNQVGPVKGVRWGLWCCEPCWVTIEDDDKEMYNNPLG